MMSKIVDSQVTNLEEMIDYLDSQQEKPENNTFLDLCEEKILDESTFQQCRETIKNTIRHVECKKTNTKAEIIYAIYKTFYNKEPNLKEENRHNLTIEIQAMTYLLAQYGLTFGDYRFSYNELMDLNMPISMELQDDIVGKLLNRDNIELKRLINRNPIKLNKYVKLIGTIVTEEIKDKEDPIESLRLISSIHYTSEYMIPNATILKIADYNACSSDEVEKVRQLVKKFELGEKV